MATGSCEGSLTIEGIPDRFESVPFTRSEGGRSRRFFGFPTRANPCDNARTRGQDAALVKTREAGDGGRIATGMSEARSHTAPWEENAHADASKRRRERCTVHVSCDDPPKRSQAS